MSQQASSARAILYALLANFGIALAKLAAALFTGSGSLLAESIHSFADCGNQVLLFIGLRQARRPPDLLYPLGYGKLSYFWSFMVALLLFSAGGLFSVYEGWHRLSAPEAIRMPWVALAVLGVSFILETVSLAGCLREITAVRAGKPFLRWLRETRNAELIVVLGEDCAALVGLAIAFVFVSLAAITGEQRLDAIGSIAIGFVLIGVSCFIGVRMKGLIVGRSAEPDLQAAINEEIAQDPNIERLLNAITLQLGPGVMLAVKIKMRAGISIEEAVDCINAFERKVRGRFPEISFCFVEPDVVD